MEARAGISRRLGRRAEGIGNSYQARRKIHMERLRGKLVMWEGRKLKKAAETNPESTKTFPATLPTPFPSYFLDCDLGSQVNLGWEVKWLMLWKQTGWPFLSWMGPSLHSYRFRVETWVWWRNVACSTPASPYLMLQCLNIVCPTSKLNEKFNPQSNVSVELRGWEFNLTIV